MIRKMILSAVLAAGTLTGLALTPGTAEAHAPWAGHVYHHRHHRFEVFYLHCGTWRAYGNYRDRDDAERAACHLRYRGYEVKIDRC